MNVTRILWQVSWLVFSAAWLVSAVPANAATLHGHVVSSTGFTIGQVRVTLSADAGTRTGSYVAVSDQNGDVTWTDLPPGSYSLTAEKPSWQRVQMRINVSEGSVFEPPTVTIKMKLTPLAFFLTRLQLGSVIYMFLFGWLVLVFNFYFVPEASKGVSAFGWTMLALAVGISVVKLFWYESIPLSLFGLGAASWIHRHGTALSLRKAQKEQQEAEQQAESAKHEVEQLKSLVGQQGITLTDLKTHGQIRVGDCELTGRASCGFLHIATPIVIVRMEGRTAVVEASQTLTQESHT